MPVLGRAEDDRRGRVPLLEAVGEVEQRVGVEPVDRLDDDVHAALGADLRLGHGDAVVRHGAAFASLRSLLELGAELAELASALVEERAGLAGGDRLDAAHARADRALGEEDERPDLGASSATCVPPQSSRE